MKIAAYTIAKDEERHVGRWAKHLKEADGLFVLDTGSADRTVQALLDNDVVVYQATYNPWRFDKPRQDLLDQIPIDYDLCMSIDMDEYLSPGWRQHIESVWTSEINRLWYSYVHKAENKFWANKFHGRHSHYWKYPVHETVEPYTTDNYATATEVILNHWPDDTKSRSSYLPLLKIAVDENPESEEHWLWYVNELLTQKSDDVDYCEYLVRQYIEGGPIVSPRYRYSMCSWLGSIMNDPDRQLYWYMRSAHEDPSARDAYWALAMYWYERDDNKRASIVAENALAKTERVYSSIHQPKAWNGDFEWLAAIAHQKLGNEERSLHWYREGTKLHPEHDELKKDYVGYLKSIKNPTTHRE